MNPQSRGNRHTSSHLIVAAVVLLAIIYAGPHTWWMAGIAVGFPGTGDEFNGAFDRTWFAVYNVAATAMVLCGAFAIAAIEYRWLWTTGFRLAKNVVMVGAVLLLLRGGMGLITTIPSVIENGLSEAGGGAGLNALGWEAWFLVTGAIYAVVTRRHR